MPSLRARAAASFLVLIALIACGPSGPGSEGLAGLTVVVDPNPASHAATTLTVRAVGSAGSTPLASFAGTVTLELTGGAVDPATLTLTGGTGTVDAIFTGVIGEPLVLTARVGPIAGSATVELGPIARVPGDASAFAADALPFLPFRPRSDEYALDAPDLPGVDLSFRTVTLVLAVGTTVGELNALLARHGAGVVAYAPGPLGAIAALRLPTTDHAAMRAALSALEVEPRVVHVAREHQYPAPVPVASSVVATTSSGLGPLLGPAAITAPSQLSNWAWEREDQPQPLVDDNWNLERIRVPQMWNLNAFVQVGALVGGPRDRLVGVLDSGFPDHPDLAFEDRLGDFAPFALPLVEFDHGLHVAGVIGAGYGNGEGIDGVQPFARLVAARYTGALGWGLLEFLEERPDLRVVNVSLGKNWYQRTGGPTVFPPNPATDPGLQHQVAVEGLWIQMHLENRHAQGRAVPLIVAAAGNDSNNPEIGFGDLDARWSSPVNYAALALGSADIVVVEAIERGFDLANQRAPYSNVGGHVSAPGTTIVSSTASAPYQYKDGTSMATPHVAGLASYLAALDPSLTNAELRFLLTSTATPVFGAAPAVDAFAAALAIDPLRGDRRVLRALLDVDDGTPDGNTRVDPFTGDEVAHVEGRFGPVGDGRVDLRDFRRFRDALLLVDVDVLDGLDGREDHPKRDLNLDGAYGGVVLENVFPRFDFNGDGRISRTATATVPGFALPVTDLQVLQSLWEDDEVFAHELDDLLLSGDVHVSASEAFDDARVGAVEIEFRSEGEGAFRPLTLDRERPRALATLPADAYEAVVRLLDQGGLALDERTEPFVLDPGADVAIRVGPPDPDLGDVLAAGTSHAVAVRPDGTVVTWGNAPPGTGTGDAVPTPTPVVVPGLEDVRSVAAGNRASYAVRRDGTLWVWGEDCNGSLGLGDVERVGAPTQVPGLSDVAAVAAAGCYAMALLGDGRVLRWGFLWDTAYGATPAFVPSLVGIRSISAGVATAFAVDAGGAAFGWGRNDFGQLAAAPFVHRSDPVAAGLPAADAVRGGSIHSVALLDDGSVAAWGYGENAGLPGSFEAVPPTPVAIDGDVVQIAAGSIWSFAVARDGRLWAWGSNLEGVFGVGAPTTDGSVLAPFPHPTLDDVVRVATSPTDFALFVRRDGTVWSAGRNAFGQLGDGTTTDRFAPVQVVGLTVP